MTKKQNSLKEKGAFLGRLTRATDMSSLLVAGGSPEAQQALQRGLYAPFVLAGSADFKTELGTSDMFDQRLQAVVLATVDVGGEVFEARGREMIESGWYADCR